MSDYKFCTNPGTATVPKYRSIVMPDGDVQLIEDGVRYLNDEIQSYEEMCNINNLVSRYMAGDSSCINQMQGVYADISNFPDSRQAALQSIFDAQSVFEQLPMELRSQFNNSWEQFYVSAGTEKFYKAMKDAFNVSDSKFEKSGEDEVKTE